MRQWICSFGIMTEVGLEDRRIYGGQKSPGQNPVVEGRLYCTVCHDRLVPAWPSAPAQTCDSLTAVPPPASGHSQGGGGITMKHVRERA